MSATATTAPYQQLVPCTGPRGHKFAAFYPPAGQFGYTTVVCARCGLTPVQARAGTAPNP